MNDFNLILTLLGGFILALALVSTRLEGSPFPATVVGLLAGAALGPHALNLIDLSLIGERAVLVERLARLALGVGLVGVAVRVPSTYPRRHAGEMVRLIGLGMPLMWAVSTGLVYLLLDLPLWMSALVGAAVTPTDPVSATPMVTGPFAEKYVPERLRHAISFESGANDGLSYLLLFLAFLMLTQPAGHALSRWLMETLLWHVLFAAALGLLLGYLAGRALQRAERAGAILAQWRLIYTVALGLFAAGLGKLLDTDELLVVFAAAAAFDQVVSEEDRKNEELGQEAVNRFFAIPIFVVVGLTIPWEGWMALGLPGLLLALGLVLLRRPVCIAVLRPVLPSLRGTPDTLFVGWFAPIGIAAIYYASMMEHRLGDPLVWHAVSLAVCVSTLAHGMSAAAGTRWYGRVTGTDLHQPPQEATRSQGQQP